MRRDMFGSGLFGRVGFLGILLAAGVSGMSGCMMMHMGQMSHGGSKVQMIIKERDSGEITIRLEVPPLVVSQEAVLTVRLTDSATFGPLEPRKVEITVSSLPEKIEAKPGRKEGDYEVRHVFTQEGKYEISARAVFDREEVSPVSVSLTQDVHPAGHGESRKVARPLLVLGGIGMALMMLLML
ncbi:MAG: hypothetical protein HY548_05755 [Elusimicrobia bacterium]|nr:hypothetical protein [Elusimicrobiota bacterium]